MAVDKELVEKFDKLFDRLDILYDNLEQKVKEKEKNNMETNKVIKLGKEVYLTDPCYDITTWCQQLLKKVKSGNWVVDYEYNEFEDGMEQQVILSVAHEDYGMTIFNDYDEVVDSASLGVDSGTIGIFDKDYYEKYHFENKIDEDWYDKNICDFTKTLRRGANITDDNGVWVNTSYGDGEYVAELYMKDGEICGIEITC